MEYIDNAAPMVIDRGILDVSGETLPREASSVPQHLPKVYTFARKGDRNPKLVLGSERINQFGEETFDERSKYATHATPLTNKLNAYSNVHMLERVIPHDAGPKANMIIWADVLETTVDLYDRNADGSIKNDALGSPIIIGTAPGVKIKWVKTYRASEDEANDYGRATIMTGSQIDPVTTQQSRLIPILEYRASWQGEYGNHCGIRMWPANSQNSILPPTEMMASQRAFPFYFQMISRKNTNASPKVTTSVFNEEFLMFTFKRDVIEPLTDAPISLDKIFIKNFNRGPDNRFPAVYSDIDGMVLYYNNLEALQALVHSKEIPFIDEFSNFTEDPDDIWLMNVLTGQTLSGSPYHTLHFIDDIDSIRFSELTNLYLEGGSDGTMNEQVFAELVSERMDEYLDRNSPLQELATNVESIFYDTGFPIETKIKLCNFIGVRRDTFVVLSTYDVNGRVLTPAEEHSLAISLRTRLQMFPESDYYGTTVRRGLIMGRSAFLRNSRYDRRLPLTFEIAIKAAKYMGAADGKWRNGKHFDGAPGSVIEEMYDISYTHVPASVRNRNWDVGLNWVGAFDIESFFFPALKTVCDDDTSVLNSFLTALACGQLNKIAHACWRQYTGSSHLTNLQLEERCNAYISNAVKDKFDDRFIIVPMAHHTDLDVLRGFSWTLPIKIYAANMKTVMTTWVQADRLSRYQAAA